MKGPVYVPALAGRDHLDLERLPSRHGSARHALAHPETVAGFLLFPWSEDSTHRTAQPTMNILRYVLLTAVVLALPACAVLPIGIGLIPGAPAYLSSVIGNGQSAYQTAMDERTSKQQMLDSIIAGHAQAELLKNKQIESTQITAYCYFGKLYLVGEYDSQEQLKTIYQCVNRVEGKRAVISRLYLRDEQQDSDFISDTAMYTDIRTQLLADFDVTSSPVDVEVIQGDIVLLGVISDKEERDRIMAHAQSVDGVNRVVSYLYHQENAGPEPHIMSAKLETAPAPKLPKRNRKSSRPATKASPKTTEKEQTLLTVANPDRGR
jgi:hyperosmotically inducible protein